MPGQKGSSMGMNMVTTAMAFSVSAFFVLFVFTRLLCARIHLRNAAAEHAADAQAGDVAIHVKHPITYDVERSVRGMEPSVVTTFPTVKFGDDSQRPPAQEESHCTVCLEEYQAKDVVRVLPYCGHAFHVACIDTWLKQQSTCPICRASMRATAKHRAAATMPPVYHAVAMAQLPFQVSTSSSEQNALQAEAGAAAATEAEAGTHHVDVTSTRLEIIISDGPAPSGAACPSATHAPAASECPCCEMMRQISQGNASEHC